MTAEPKESRYSVSMFMITINPGVRFRNGIDSPEFANLYHKLRALGNLLLTKKSIRSSLVFRDRKDKATGLTVALDRDTHLSKIMEISPDRSAGIEIGDRDKKLHLHIQFEIRHRTFLQLNIPYYNRIAGAVLGMDPKKVYVHVSAATRSEGYKRYVEKGVNELAPHFFDAAANTFSVYSTADSLSSAASIAGLI
jgi:hypothetical protein